jgi:haloacetate dehalogenase
VSAPVDLSPGFAEPCIASAGAVSVLRRGGVGAPLLLLHGHPAQVCWHRLAPEPAQQSTLVVPERRGYGASSAPGGDAEHLTYFGRATARDCLEGIYALGHDPCGGMGRVGVLRRPPLPSARQRRSP